MIRTTLLSIAPLAALLLSAFADDDASTGQPTRIVKLDNTPTVPGGNYDKFGWSAAAKLTYKALVPKGLKSTAVVYAHHLPTNISPSDALAAMQNGFESGKLKWAKIGEASGMLEVPLGVTLVKPENVAAHASEHRIVSFERGLLPGHDTGAKKWVTFDMKPPTASDLDQR